MTATLVNEKITPVEDIRIRVLDRGEVLTLAYDGAMSEHIKTLWWGTAVGFRAMQGAAIGLSKDGLWSRDNLYVVTGHPGKGVRDSVNYVTRCFDRDRYKVVRKPDCGSGCNSSMRYEWWVSDGEKTAAVKLRPDFVGLDFYKLVDRLGIENEKEEDRRLFEIYKVNLSIRLWNAPLEENMSIEVSDTPLKPGEVPAGAFPPEWVLK